MFKVVSLPQASSWLKTNTTKQYGCTIFVVLAAHVFLLWLLAYVYQPFSLPTLDKTAVIRVHMMQAQSQNNHADSTIAQLQSSPAEPQSHVEPAQTSHVKKEHQKIEQTIIQTHQSTKKTTQSGAQAQLESSKPIIKPKQHTDVAQLTTVASDVSHNQLQHQGAEYSQEIALRSGGSEAAKDTQNSQLPNAQNNEPQPLQVNQVDILNMGAIKYNDRSLQNQNRLVILTIYIDAKGQVTRITMRKSSGLEHLDNLVIKAAEKAKFKPHLVNGQAVPVVVEYPFQLNLSRR